MFAFLNEERASIADVLLRNNGSESRVDGLGSDEYQARTGGPRLTMVAMEMLSSWGHLP